MTKRCPKCGQSYADQGLNFCLSDGELLMFVDDAGSSADQFSASNSRFADDEPPPTMVMNDPRATNPTGWSAGPLQAGGQGTSPIYQAPQGAVLLRTASDQTLPLVSLLLGVFALILVCCYGGIWLGLPAAIVGFIGLKNTERDPMRFGGRGLAIAGLVLGLVTFIASTIFLIAGLLA